MLYLLDANVLLDAHRDYYPIRRIPEFWEWLLEMATERLVKVPLEQYEEVVTPRKRDAGAASESDALVEWLIDHKDVMVLNELAPEQLVANVTHRGYGSDLTEDEVEKIGRDPFLIAYALADKVLRCVVTTERSKPNRQRANRHVPDVCDDFKVRCIHTFVFIRELNFHTGWRASR